MRSRITHRTDNIAFNFLTFMKDFIFFLALCAAIFIGRHRSSIHYEWVMIFLFKYFLMDVSFVSASARLCLRRYYFNFATSTFLLVFIPVMCQIGQYVIKPVTTKINPANSHGVAGPQMQVMR